MDSSIDQIPVDIDAKEVDEGKSVPPKTASLTKRRLLYISLLAAGALAMILVGVLVQKPTNFEEYLTSSGYGGVFLMAVIGSASPVWPLPGSWAVFIAAGLGLNPFLLGLAAGIGEPIGELSGYTAGFGGQIAINKWKRYAQIERWMKKHGGLTIFLISAIPNFFIKLATVAAGALRYPLWKFFIFCWGGKTIKSLCFAFAGAGLFDGIKALIDRIF
ncbi:MAG: VTT domain-containing protein [Dehalococcoidia bacterium]|nr:VTT domain-containing protein [Dehalococcoidia bacterium]